MKTKRIVALALTAAMALSMSMTAFAAQWQDFERTDDSSDGKTHTTYWGIKYKVDGKDNTHIYYLQEAEKVVKTKEDVTTGEIETWNGISAATKAAKGDTEAVVPFSKIKDTLEVPANDPESDYKFYGWSETAGVKSDKEDDAFKDKKVKDDANVAKMDGAQGGVVTFYPMLLKKSVEDKVKDAQEIAARPKIAKTKDDKDWKYTAQEICAVKSKEKASSDSGKEDCEKCNTTTGKAVVFDVKPVVRESGKEVILRTSKKPQVEVILPITRLLTKDEKTKAQSDSKGLVDDLKKQIKENKDNQVKVFHIGSDGKSHPVTNFEIVWSNPTGVTEAGKEEVCVKFKYGSFSDFVVTRDKDAKAQAGEEEGASGGNPATGEASALPVAMLALAALSATGVVAYKKRKAE